MHQPSYAFQQRYSPFCPVDWRWQRASALRAERKNFSQRRDDSLTGAALAYQRALARCRAERERGRLERRWPALAAAHRLAESNQPLRWEVDARLLLGQDDEAIGTKCGLETSTVRMYEALFFNVRDSLLARDWVTAAAIGPGLWLGFPAEQLGKLWAAFAFHTRSELILETIMAVTQDLPLPPGLRQRLSASGVDEAQLRTSAKLAVAALMLPPSMPLSQTVELRELARRAEDALQAPADPINATATPLILDALADALASASRAAVTPPAVA